MRNVILSLSGLLTMAFLSGVCLNDRAEAADNAEVGTAEKFLLRYQFRTGETLRWKVSRQTKTDANIDGESQVTETSSQSVKCWRVIDVKPDGTATFEHSVESVDMCNLLPGQEEVRYNSRTDKTVPPAFQNVAQSVGVSLSIFTLDSRGTILKRERKQATMAMQNRQGQVTLPLPKEAIAVGHTWSQPQDIEVPLRTGGIKRVKSRQKFTLRRVKTGVATIEIVTQILTPIHDPAIEAQLVQREMKGTIRFDIDAGRILSQKMDLDKHVVGFHTGASSVRYVTRFSEELLPSRDATANLSASRRQNLPRR